MVRNKLSDHDQTTLVRLYRKSTLTATVLAEYYTVSPSTITRLLKEAIPEQEYRELVNQKRSLARRKDVPELGVEHVGEILQILDEEEQAKAEAALASESETTEEEEICEPPTADLNGQAQPAVAAAAAPWISEAAPEEWEDEENAEDDDEDEDQDWDDSDVSFDPEVLHDLEEEIDHFPQEGEDDEDEGDEEYDEDDEVDDLEEEEDDEDSQGDEHEYSYEQNFEILPLEELDPPHLCFVVVDRFDELATRPLRDFMPTNMGGATQEGLPMETAAQAKTLPIFDNQRVARRFSQMSRRGSHPSQRNRVIQFPGYLLDVVRSQLQSKGITHLLVDGQVYSL